jgi:hypothetical protein
MAQASAITTVHADRRRRPVWVVAALSFLTLDLYGIVWIGLSWAELKRERNDPNMHPWWHALTLVVPFYGLFRIHAHFRTLNELLAGIGLTRRVPPGRAVIAIVVSAAIGRIGSLPMSPVATLVLLIVSGALFALPIALGQRSLNEYYGALPMENIPTNARWFEWVILAIGAALWFLIVLGSLAPA